MSTTEPVNRFTPQEIIAKLDSQFEKARQSGDLLFFPSTVHKHTDVGVDVRFSLSSSLSATRNHSLHRSVEELPNVQYLMIVS